MTTAVPRILALCALLLLLGLYAYPEPAGAAPARVQAADTANRQEGLRAMRTAWDSLAPAFGRRIGSTMPRVRFTTSTDATQAGARWNTPATKVGSRVLVWPDWLNDPLIGRPSTDSRVSRSIALMILLHEWVQYLQDETLPKWSSEGGAQLFTRAYSAKTAKALGFTLTPLAFDRDIYRTEMTEVEKCGEPWIYGGQFMAARGTYRDVRLSAWTCAGWR